MTPYRVWRKARRAFLKRFPALDRSPPPEGFIGSYEVLPNHIMRLEVEYHCAPGARAMVEGIGANGIRRFARNLDDTQNHRHAVFYSENAERITALLRPQTPKDVTVKALRLVPVQEKRGEPTSLFGDSSVTVAMATYPPREKMFRDALESLVPQADNILVYLNNYRRLPGWLCDLPEHVHWILDTASTKRASAKFSWAHEPGFHVLCDDDIIYPSDYVDTMIAAIERHRRQAIVGVHAAVYERDVTDSIRSRQAVYRFVLPLEEETPVHLLGTGTVAFHSDTVVDFDWSLIRQHNIFNDESFAVLAKRAGVPMLAQPREKDWMQSHPSMKFGIFEEKGLEPAIRKPVSELLAAHNPWPAPLPVPSACVMSD